MRGWWLRLVRLLRPRASDRDIEEELRFHVEMEAEALRRSGVPPAEARRRARMALGGEDRWREETRDARGTAWLEDTLRDLRFAARAMRCAPGFTAAAVGTLALGVGATTTIYSVVDQVVLAPLPYADPDDLVAVWTSNPALGVERGMTSWPNFEDWRDATTTLQAMAAVVPGRRTLTGRGEPVEVRTASVSAGFFEMVGAPLALGRPFGDGEVEGAFAGTAVLSHGLFVRRFGSDPSVLGRTILLDGHPVEVVGVTRPGAAYPSDTDVWLPLTFGTGRQWRDPRGRLWLPVVGRLADGVGRDVAQREFDELAARLASEFPDTNQGSGVLLEPLQRTLVGDVRTPFLVLLGAVTLVLLIAVVNVGNLLLARGTARAREVAARRALGAGRGRVVRQVLAEGAVLGAAGGALGACMAAAGVMAFAATAPADLPRLDTVGVDGVVLSMSLLLALTTSVAFSALPAVQAARVDPATTLRASARSTASTGLRGLSGVLVGGQFALAFVLLVGAGLLARSFVNLRTADPGFDVDDILAVEVSLPRDRYADADARRAFHEALLRDVAALPGVESAGTVSDFFLSDLPSSGSLTVEGVAARPGAPDVHVVTDAVSPSFFATLGMRLVAGRVPQGTDGPDDPPVAVVNEAFVRAFLEGQDPVGRRYTWGRPTGESTYWFAIIGVVRDARRSGLDAPVLPAVFESALQRPRHEVELFLRTQGDPSASIAPVRSVLAGLDAELAVARIQTLEAAVSGALAQRRLVVGLLGGFSLAALTLAAIGIFGVTAYVVGRRTREIGIRLALGAPRTRVLGQVVRVGMLQAGAGLVAGGAAALAATRIVRSQLVGIDPVDPATFLGAATVLMVVAGLACAIPARRAARVEPVVALSQE